jgi:hypothetical protein
VLLFVIVVLNISCSDTRALLLLLFVVVIVVAAAAAIAFAIINITCYIIVVGPTLGCSAIDDDDDIIVVIHVKWALVTMAWHVLRLQIGEKASRYDR